MVDVYRLKVIFQSHRPVYPWMLPQIRGYMGRQFMSNHLFHNHSDNGLLYRYPLIQYKCLGSRLVMIGINAGAEALYNVLNTIETITLQDKVLNITGKKIDIAHFKVRLTETFTIYKFITPYFAFNQENYKRFRQARDQAQKKAIIDGILTGNILSFLKSLQYRIKEKLVADFFYTGSPLILFKDMQMQGLTGEFASNIKLPDYIGLGKASALGNGVIMNNRRKKHECD